MTMLAAQNQHRRGSRPVRNSWLIRPLGPASWPFVCRQPLVTPPAVTVEEVDVPLGETDASVSTLAGIPPGLCAPDGGEVSEQRQGVRPRSPHLGDSAWLIDVRFSQFTVAALVLETGGAVSARGPVRRCRWADGVFGRRTVDLRV